LLFVKQISAAKSKVIKHLDEIEERLITEVESVQEKHQEKTFEAESKGKTDSQDLWLSERQALQHKTSC
jgi:hypothetical protein